MPEEEISKERIIKTGRMLEKAKKKYSCYYTYCFSCNTMCVYG